jgi:protein arginine N-methyltransferase 1
MTAFRRAIAQVVRPGDVVLDAGTGTGILAFLACDAGARRVYAVERQHTADAAAMLARQLGYADRVTMIHGRTTEIELPERATLLTTETIGPLVFNEGILEIVADARRRLLAPGARMIPSHIDLWIAPAELPNFYERLIDWWRTPRLGFDFSAIRTFAANTVYSEKVARDHLLAAPETAMSIELRDLDDTAQRGTASFRAARDGVVQGFALGFAATLADGVMLTNQWSGAGWDQGVLPLETPVTVTAGTPIDVDVRTDNGAMWHWRGRIGDTEFAQTTLLSRPPCIAVE